jgi:hypothetical protein
MQIMLTKVREVAKVAYSVVCVIAAVIILGIYARYLVVRLTKVAEIRGVDRTIRGVVWADDLDIDADRNRACLIILESLTLTSNPHATGKDAATTSDTSREGRLTVDIGDRVGSDRASAEAKLLSFVTGIYPVIRPRNTLDASASYIPDNNPDVIIVAAATVTDELKVTGRAYTYSESTARSGFTFALIHVTSMDGGCENQQQREKQDFSFEHLVNLLNLQKGLGPLRFKLSGRYTSSFRLLSWRLR